MDRPGCVVHAWDLPSEPRPRYTALPGIGALVRHPSDAVGLTHMGVHIRTIEPGKAGTNRHFHLVEEEWVYVLSGHGTARIGPHRLAVRAGSFVGFPPGPRPHHFLAEGDEPLVLLEGGERRPADDIGCWVDIPTWWRAGRLLDQPEALPSEEGDIAQCVHIDALAAKDFQHDVVVYPEAGVRRVRGLLEPLT